MLARIKRMIPKPVKRWLLSSGVGMGRPPKRQPYQPGAFAPGVNLYGFLSASLGLGQAARLYAQALRAARVPLALLDEQAALGRPCLDTALAERLADAPAYQLSAVHVNPDALRGFFRHRPAGQWDRRYMVGVWLWELPRIPRQWLPYLPMFDEFWAPSRFIAQAMRQVTDKPVIDMPYGVSVAPDPALTRAHFGLPPSAFLVLCMFDVKSYTARKNPAAAVRAFFAALGGQEDARLVLKLYNASEKELRQLRALCGHSPRVVLVNREFTKPETDSLIACCDALISLHRSEGFGLVMAEAMALGVPVVATGYSANTDFMDETCACLVDYTLVPSKGRYLYGEKTQQWAEPDAAHAARHLRRLYEEPAFRRQIAQAGRERIERDFSVEACASRMSERLRELGISPKG